eukprot:jgi/Galph1/3590/GphlegSOOS_G2251.1
MSQLFSELEDKFGKIEQDLEVITNRLKDEFELTYTSSKVESTNPISISRRIKILHKELPELLENFEKMINEKHSTQEHIQKRLLGNTKSTIEYACKQLGEEEVNPYQEELSRCWDNWNKSLRQYFQLYASADALEDDTEVNANLEVETMRADAFASLDKEERREYFRNDSKKETEKQQNLEKEYPFVPIAKSAFQRLPRNLRTKSTLEELNQLYEKVWKLILSRNCETVPTIQILKIIGEEKKEQLEVLRGLAVVSFTSTGWVLTRRKVNKTFSSS